MAKIFAPGDGVAKHQVARTLVFLGLTMVAPATAQANYPPLPDAEGRIVYLPAGTGSRTPALHMPDRQNSALKLAARKRPATSKNNADKIHTGTVKSVPQPLPRPKIETESQAAPGAEPRPAGEPSTGTVKEPTPKGIEPPQAADRSPPPGVPPGRKFIDPDHPIEPDANPKR